MAIVHAAAPPPQFFPMRACLSSAESMAMEMFWPPQRFTNKQAKDQYFVVPKVIDDP